MLEKENKKIASPRHGSNSNAPTPMATNPKKNGMLPPNGAAPQPVVNSPTSFSNVASNTKRRKYTRRKSTTSSASAGTNPAFISKRPHSEPVTPTTPTTPMTPANGNNTKPLLASSLSTVTETPYEDENENEEEELQSTKKPVKPNKRSKKLATSTSSSNHPTPPLSDSVLETKQLKKSKVRHTKKNSPNTTTLVVTKTQSATATPLTADEILSGSSSSNDMGSINSVLPNSGASATTPRTEEDPLHHDPTLGDGGYQFDDADILSMDADGVVLAKSDSKGMKPKDYGEVEHKLDDAYNLDFSDPSANYSDFNFLNWQ